MSARSEKQHGFQQQENNSKMKAVDRFGNKKRQLVQCTAVVLLICSGLLLSRNTRGESITVLRADTTALSEWKQREFDGRTLYETIQMHGKSALRARSNGTASAFYREIEIDLETFPFMTWSWNVESAPENPLEREKRGDDYAARVYVVVKTGPFPWQLLALNYVWSMHDNAKASWPSPYSDKVVMIPVMRGKAGFGRWHTHQVNLKGDLEAVFGEAFSMIQGVAIMTDMDNTGKTATAYYGDIVFSSD